jgi:hypothetical protein
VHWELCRSEWSGRRKGLWRLAFVTLIGCGETLSLRSDPDEPPRVTAPPPGIVDLVTADERDRASALTFASPTPDGVQITAYEYDVNADAQWRPLGADRIVLALTNGERYRFRVRPLNDHGPALTPSAQSNEIVPYGAPEPPTVAASASGKTIRWKWTPNDGNGRAVTRYEHQLDGGAFVPTAEQTFSQAFGANEPHTLCVVALNDGVDPARSRSAPECAAFKLSLPIVVAESTGDAFDTAGAGGKRYDNEVVNNKSIAIDGACFRDPDITSNNGWWYRLAPTGHWAAATVFTKSVNEVGAPRVFGGATSNCN